ncbi:transmembrane protease serine 13a [Labrus bergylta]|uniref:transmembrane protease serine 13a n=1 Tax=Labrus bergylta TaxID=56723 RepID=UPI003313224F
MANIDSKDPPPPYYPTSIHTLPPLKSYEEVVYGIGPGLTPPNHPRYIPRYPTHVVVPQVTTTNTFPSKKRRRCCNNNAQCFGGSGGSLLVVGLLALAIWLGVRFGTRFVPGDNSNNNHYSQPFVNPSSPRLDSCPNTTVECDGISDCELETDEANCVRFKSDGQLQVKTAEDGSFQPVCYSGWNQSHANQTCAQLGFRSSYSYKSTTDPASTALTMTGKSSVPIQGRVKISPSCPNQEVVSLQCTDCGKQQSTARIIGGAAAKSGQWPWQLSLHHRGSHICGAVLISPDFVLTAAHCIPSLSTQNLKVYGGVMSLNSLPSPYLVEKIILNHNYNSTTHDQDIALLKLKSPVVFNNKVQPVCLPAFDFSFSHGTRCWTSGFGVTDVDKATVSRELMEVFVSIISTAMCNSRHGYGGAVTGNMICAGTLQGGRDSCQGDSGGPLMCESENRWYLVGITSWGDSCGLRNKPGVYTRVSSLLSWIYSTMQQEKP